jgi:hypothetical protein
MIPQILGSSLHTAAGDIVSTQVQLLTAMVGLTPVGRA